MLLTTYNTAQHNTTQHKKPSRAHYAPPAGANLKVSRVFKSRWPDPRFPYFPVDFKHDLNFVDSLVPAALAGNIGLPAGGARTALPAGT